MKKRSFIILLVTMGVVFFAASAAAENYYNAVYEVEDIQYYINRGYYLEAIQECDYTLTSFNLSPDDVSLISGYRATAQQRYSDYINGADTYYNAAAEVNQIRYFINNGLYLEAIRDCENTLSWHYLSPSDTGIVTELEDTAYSEYYDYLDRAQEKNSIDIMWNAIQGYWFHTGDPYTQSTNIEFKPDGTFYLRTWRVKGYGTYTVTGANTVFVNYDVYFRGAGQKDFDYYYSTSAEYQMFEGDLYEIDDDSWTYYEHRNSFTEVYGQD